MMNFYEYFNRKCLDLYDKYFDGICQLYQGMDPKYNWSKVMHILKKDPFSAYSYAAMVNRRRWREAEKVIQMNQEIWNDYKWYFRIE